MTFSQVAQTQQLADDRAHELAAARQLLSDHRASVAQVRTLNVDASICPICLVLGVTKVSVPIHIIII
jgi:hypothetical protein